MVSHVTQMDLLSELPPEISDLILRRLSARELCRCLAVSKTWRHLANMPHLWEAFCRSKQLSLKSQTGEQLGLCCWAYTYITHMREVTRNWREGHYTSHTLTKEADCCCIGCFRNTMVVYYPRVSIARLYQVSSDSVKLIASFLPDLPIAIAMPYVYIDENYVLLSRGNAIILYSYTSYALHKFLVKEEQGLSITNTLRAYTESGWRMNALIVRKNVIWLECDSYQTFVYIVDLERNEYRVMSDTFRCLCVYEDTVYAANDVVSIYALSGEKLFSLNVNHVTDLWVGEDSLVCLIGRNELTVQIWSTTSKSMLNTFSVDGYPCVCFGPASEDLFMLEFGDESFKLRCISLKEGSTRWVYTAGFQRELVLHPEIHLLCDRFLFVRPSSSNDNYFLLLESRSGYVVYDSPMPPSLHPPSRIYHLSDQIFITAESRVIHIRCYV